ncbi:peptidoglycan D,D-transpeptidase FtsI family protein [Tepidibacter aestuarii]|uniref:peptidoglycan D,D-transpeptidase FtsI family protein n=1 Tax=Tepidibacter aestuarii TaxID=2925782 RepID=UPI0020C0A99B|nr:penicillin-binding transpeptidase domain-containing protein [Tepidibacter aestuarii]CAH2212918.1 Penicillin-binding protein 2 [Tepidibacter aestuarii]
MRKKSNTKQNKRLSIVLFTFSFIFISLFARLIYIQGYKGKEYYERAIRQSEIKIDLTSNRGTVYDRNNVALTDNEKEDIVVILKRNFNLDKEKIDILKKVTKLSEKEIYNKFESKSDLIELKIKYLNDELRKEIENKSAILIVNKTYRYRSENILTHVLGYINKYENKGVSGVEKAKNNLLKDQNKEYVEAFVDARKNVVPGSFKKYKSKDINHKNVKLTIDYDIQSIVEKALDKKHKNGAVVVSDVNTGEILAMASRPNFNPNKVEDYIDSENQELLNKAIQCKYPPGSIFKIIVTLAAFEEGVVDEEEKFECNGYIEFDGIKIKCWERDGHGEETFKEAFYNSCNPVFVEVGKRLGSKKILETAKRMGLSDKVDIGLEEEKETSLPKGDTVKGNAIGNISIGQGDIEVTPLQVNQMTQIIANNGAYKKLYLFDSILDQNMNEIENHKIEKDKVVMSPFIINRTKKLMEGVVEAGTAKNIKGIQGNSAGKTGSAEYYVNGQKFVHGWFTGYYPAKVPKYAVTVFVYDGKSGGGAAAPVFKDIIENINNIKQVQAQ